MPVAWESITTRRERLVMMGDPKQAVMWRVQADRAIIAITGDRDEPIGTVNVELTKLESEALDKIMARAETRAAEIMGRAIEARTEPSQEPRTPLQDAGPPR